MLNLINSGKTSKSWPTKFTSSNTIILSLAMNYGPTNFTVSTNDGQQGTEVAQNVSGATVKYVKTPFGKKNLKKVLSRFFVRTINYASGQR